MTITNRAQHSELSTQNFLPVHRDRSLRAHEATNRASGTAPLPDLILRLMKLGGVVAKMVDRTRHRDELPRTDRCAQLAALAPLLVDLYASVHQMPTAPF